MGELHLQVVVERLRTEWKLGVSTGKMRVAPNPNPGPYRSPYPSPSPNPNVLEGEGRAVVHEREHVEPGDLRRRQHRRALLVRVRG